jgi:hypothetical protein
LESPFWKEVLHEQDATASSSLRITLPTLANQTLTKLSALLVQIETSQEIGEITSERLVTQLITIRKEIEQQLSDTVQRAGHPDCNLTFIIDCKYAIYLIMLNTAILEILGRHSFSDVGKILRDSGVARSGVTDLLSTTILIEDRITSAFGIFHSNLALASTCTPFGMRKMAFMARVVCADRRKRGMSRHPVWSRVEMALSGVNEPEWLAKMANSAIGKSCG